MRSVAQLTVVPVHQRSNSRSRPRVGLRVEELESRTVLSIYTPAQIVHAYGFDRAAFIANGQTVKADGSGQTIAIVDAYDDPAIAADLATFSGTLGLPPASFTKATPQGQPVADAGWSGEISLDVEWAHAVAPGASILLVEAKSSSLSDLLGAVNYARQQPGVSVVSMSWGGAEFAGETAYDSYFTTPAGHQGVTFVASSGDSGAWYGVDWPAASPNVLSVGGTSLTLTTAGAYSGETVWSGSGGGYSVYESRPSYQNTATTSRTRTNPDVAYDANPNTGYYVLDTAAATPGWYQYGGTSAGAPQWAGVVALANQARVSAGKTTLDGATQTLPAIYSMPAANFHDVTSGSNGYAARVGYDLATGRGSPNVAGVVQALAAVASVATPVAPALAPHTISGATGGKAQTIVVAAPQQSAMADVVSAVIATSSVAPSAIQLIAPRQSATPAALVVVGPIVSGANPITLSAVSGRGDGWIALTGSEGADATPSQEGDDAGAVLGVRAGATEVIDLDGFAELLSLGSGIAESGQRTHQEGAGSAEEIGAPLSTSTLAGLLLLMGSYWSARPKDLEEERSLVKKRLPPSCI